MTNGNVSKILAAATVLCALAACNNNKHPINPEVKTQPKGVAGGTGAAASGCPGSAALTEKDITDAPPPFSHYDKEGQLSMDCTAEITTPGKEGSQCLSMQKSQGSEPAPAGQKGSVNSTMVSASGADLQAWGFNELQAVMSENTADNSLAPSQFRIDHAGQNSPESIEKGTVTPIKIGTGDDNKVTFPFDTVESEGKGGKTAVVSHTLTMTCNVTSAAKTPSPEKTAAPAPEKTAAPAPEKTGVPAPQKTGTPAQQQAPSKGGSQQK